MREGERCLPRGEWAAGLMGEKKEKKEEKRLKNNNIIIWSRKLTVPEKSPKIPGGRKRHPEE